MSSLRCRSTLWDQGRRSSLRYTRPGRRCRLNCSSVLVRIFSDPPELCYSSRLLSVKCFTNVSCIIIYNYFFICALLEPPSKRRFDGFDRLMNSSDSVCRISASWRDDEECFPPAASFDLDVGVVRAQSQRVHIGANDVTNSAHFGVAVDFVDRGLFLAKTIL